LIEVLRPKLFFAGILLGFLACCFLGYGVSKKARFTHYTRLFNAISPRMQYYPTTQEFLNTADHLASKEKILVLIGGSSVFRGSGQNPEETWTNELQRLLGNQYTVLNYAVDGGGLTTVGAVLFRALSERYKKIIFVSTATPGGSGPVDGVEPYGYFFWEAYYKRLFHPDEIELKRIHNMQKEQIKTASGLEKQIANYLDSFLYFRNLWNWVSYRSVFSIWVDPPNTDTAYRKPFGPRRYYKEESHPDLISIREAVRKDQARFDNEWKGYGEMVRYFVSLKETEPKLDQKLFSEASNSFVEAFTPSYRSKIVCVVLSLNRKHISMLPKKMQEAYDLILQRTQKDLSSLGYHAILVGQDYSPDDFFDGTHLYVTGGNKVAAAVATEVRNIALANHYV